MSEEERFEKARESLQEEAECQDKKVDEIMKKLKEEGFRKMDYMGCEIFWGMDSGDGDRSVILSADILSKFKRT